MRSDPRSIGEWCNGSTTDSDSVCLGSNPSSPASQFGFQRISFLGIRIARQMRASLMSMSLQDTNCRTFVARIPDSLRLSIGKFPFSRDTPPRRKNNLTARLVDQLDLRIYSIGSDVPNMLHDVRITHVSYSFENIMGILLGLSAAGHQIAGKCDKGQKVACRLRSANCRPVLSAQVQNLGAE